MLGNLWRSLLGRPGWMGAGCLLIASLASAQTSEDPDEPDQSDLGGEPIISHGAPGELTVDASDGNGVLEMPEEGMVFSSNAELIDWAETNMNGIAETDENGNRVGIFGKLTVYGKLVYGDANTETSEAIDDYMVAKLGGKSGVVIVDGQEYCLKENGCSSGLTKDSQSAFLAVHAVRPKNVHICSQPDFCVAASSWKKSVPASWFPLYRTIGSDIEQKAGGFQVSHHFCWKWIIPWSCSRKTGANVMFLHNAYRFETGNIIENAPNVGAGVIEQYAVRNNVESINIRMWSLFVSIRSNGVPGAASTAEAELKGVCGDGSSTSTGAIPANTETAAGDVRDVCDN